jgi:hypothetical protein
MGSVTDIGHRQSQSCIQVCVEKAKEHLMIDGTSLQMGPGHSWRRPTFSHVHWLWLFMVLVAFHWSEHLSQMYQIYVMGWLPAKAGGMLGLWFPAINKAEVLHTTYNLLLWGGILLLLPGFKGRARGWWMAALVIQSWHLFEHILLQVQWLTGNYLFGAPQQISIGQLWFPRPELHFAYNLLVFTPMMVAVVLYMRSQLSQR